MTTEQVLARVVCRLRLLRQVFGQRAFDHDALRNTTLGAPARKRPFEIGIQLHRKRHGKRFILVGNTNDNTTMVAIMASQLRTWAGSDARAGAL